MALNDGKRGEVFMQAIHVALERALKEVVDKAYEEAKKGLIEKLDRERDKEVASITLGIMKMVDFQMMAERLVITVKKEDVPK